MNLDKRITTGRVLSALDLGRGMAAVVPADKKNDGTFEVLGAGECALQGIEGGHLKNIGDAVESVLEASGKAERASGLKIETLYFNWSEPGVVPTRAKGAKQLAGEGQVQSSDIRDARLNAERLIAKFETTPVYAREAAYIIDGKDRVREPRGVFGSKLEVEMVLLLGSASERDLWKKVFRRAHLDRTIPVLTAWSVAYGILPPADRQARRLIWHSARDLTCGFIFEENRICEYAGFVTGTPAQNAENLAHAAEPWNSHHKPLEILLTGENAENPAAVERCTKAAPDVSLRVAKPAGVPQLDLPRHAAMAGLLQVADELEADRPLLTGQGNRLSGLKAKAAAFLNDYF